MTIAINSATPTTRYKELILTLHEIQAVKFGTFTLKSGIESPIYLDLRLIISYPYLLKEIAEAIHDKAEFLPFDLVCGVPYTALPMATAFSIEYNKPMVMRRKEAKDYGTKRIIEGAFQPGQNCVVIEDLITSGGSVLETVEALNKEGLIVTDAVAIIDRQQGGAERLKNEGIAFHSLFTLSELLEVLKEENRLDEETVEKTYEFIRTNQIK